MLIFSASLANKSIKRKTNLEGITCSKMIRKMIVMMIKMKRGLKQKKLKFFLCQEINSLSVLSKQWHLKELKRVNCISWLTSYSKKIKVKGKTLFSEILKIMYLVLDKIKLKCFRLDRAINQYSHSKKN